MILGKTLQKKISILFSLIAVLCVTSCASQGVTFVNQTNVEEQVSSVKETYLIDIGFEGGTGKAFIESPVEVTSVDGDLSAVFVWSGVNYDYMIVNGEKIEAEIIDDHSTFKIPVTAFDYRQSVIADTTAMSKPYEITYSLRFDSKSIVNHLED